MPSRELHFRLESGPSAATLYVHGRLTVAGAVLALRPCYTLPVAVVELRVDLRTATITEPASLQALAMLLVRWRLSGAERRTRMDLPPAEQRPAPAAKLARRERAPRPMRPRSSARA